MTNSKATIEIQAPISSKGQVTIPKAVRDRLHVRPGSRVSFLVHSEGNVELRAPKYTIDELVGILKPLAIPIEEQVRIAAEEHAEHVAHEG
ncbi:MAG TPA: AbrB/MazE/SpoVT family DNA-binding domain-containing protein [Chloroflexota bacterium]|nr:AbrB/MazE/SpoVT family DNA-binding domain-containing protein [Chloroflexota bacterium]